MESRGQLTNLVHEQSSTVRQLEEPKLACHRPGEGAALVTEEFRLQQVLLDRRAVDVGERPFGPG